MEADAIRRSAEAPNVAGQAELPAVARDLSDAFHDDPHFNWFIRGGAGKEAARRDFFHFLITNLTHAGRIDRPEGGGAAAVWMPSSWATTPASLIDDLRTAPTMLRATGLARFGRLMRLRKVMEAQHPTDREHLYLWFLGVTPGLQGMGIGSRLLRAGLNRADEAGMPAYLETGTEKNVALYRRHGFEPIHAEPVAPAGPMMWHMWREAGGG